MCLIVSSHVHHNCTRAFFPLVSSPYSRTQHCLEALQRGRPGGGAADAEIKVPAVENTELKGFPFKAWSRSVLYMLRLLPGISSLLISTFRFIHLHFFQTSPDFFFRCWLWLIHGSCTGPQNKIGHPTGCRFPC